MGTGRGRVAGAVAAGLVAALTVGFGVAGFAPAGVADDDGVTAGSPGGNPAGTATAAGALVHYGDKEMFFPGAATPAPTTTLPQAAGSFDNAGTGHARAAMVFNPYEEFGGAANSLTPAGFPQLPFDTVRARQYAMVDGEAPQAQDASVAPGGAPVRAGTVKAALEEAGPAAAAEATALAGTPAPNVVVDSATTRIRVARVDGQAASTATTVLDGVTVAGVLRLESIVLTATSTADGAAGKSAASVRVSGAAVGGTPVEITGEGIMVSGNAIPANAKAVSDALKSAGLELTAPGGQTVEPAAQDSRAEARGPSFRMTTADGRRFEVTLGLASTSSVLFDVDRPATEASAGTASAAQSGSTGSAPPAGPDRPAPSDVQPADPRMDAAASPTAAPAAASPPAASAGTWPAWPEDAAGVPAEARLALSTNGAARPPRRARTALAEPIALATPEAARRFKLVYGTVAAAVTVLAVAAFGLPPGARWAEDE